MKVFILATLLVAALAQYARPRVSTDFPPRPYKFAYAVEDPPSRNSYGHSESSDGKIVSGTYRVLLPDGRNQIVTYKADDNGYVAKVQYEGSVKPTNSDSARIASSTPGPLYRGSIPVNRDSATYYSAKYE